jgi:hypothetical protein
MMQCFGFFCTQVNKQSIPLSVAIAFGQQNKLEQFFQLAGGGGVSSLQLFHVVTFQYS